MVALDSCVTLASQENDVDMVADVKQMAAAAAAAGHNKEIKDKALFECERGGQQQANTDQFKCGWYKKNECTYYQMQTRNADIGCYGVLNLFRPQLDSHMPH